MAGQVCTDLAEDNDVIDTVIKKIENIYETIDIYRSMLVYDDTVDISSLRKSLMSRDFSLVNTNQDRGRMYIVSAETLSDDNGIQHLDDYIDWSTINVLICIGDAAAEVGSYFYEANHGIMHMYTLAYP